jgi:fucose permease
MLIGAVAFNIMLGILGYANQYWQFIIILLFFGSSRNLLNLSTNTQAVGVQGFYSKSIITTFHGIWSLAALSGVATCWVMKYFNVSTTWHLLSVSIVLCLLSFISFPNTLHQKPEPKEDKPIFLLPDKALLKFAIICFASMACENVMYDWNGVYLKSTVNVTSTTLTTGYLVFMIAVAIGRFIGDRVIGTFGIKRLLITSSIFIISGFALAILFPYVLSAISGFGLIGLGVSCMVPLVYSAAGKSKTMSGGPAIAAVSTIGYLGFLFVPPFVGFVAQAANLRVAFAVIAMLGFVIIWMSSKIREEA